jgi:hypothetical protein
MTVIRFCRSWPDTLGTQQWCRSVQGQVMYNISRLAMPAPTPLANTQKSPLGFDLVVCHRAHLCISEHICGQARLNSSQSNPKSRTTPRTVPNFRSLLPQSGRGANPSVAGLYHLRCDPPLLRGSSSHPSLRSFRATSRYLMLRAPKSGSRPRSAHRAKWPWVVNFRPAWGHRFSAIWGHLPR